MKKYPFEIIRGQRSKLSKRINDMKSKYLDLLLTMPKKKKKVFHHRSIVSYNVFFYGNKIFHFRRPFLGQRSKTFTISGYV